MGLPLPIDPRDETTVAAVDDNDIRGDVDGCLRNRARSAFQDRVRLLRVVLLVRLSAGKELLEQSHLSLRHRGHPVSGERERTNICKSYIRRVPILPTHRLVVGDV